MAKHFEDRSSELKDINALLKNEKGRKKGAENFKPFPIIFLLLDTWVQGGQ
jgi:hypothetical protein